MLFWCKLFFSNFLHSKIDIKGLTKIKIKPFSTPASWHLSGKFKINIEKHEKKSIILWKKWQQKNFLFWISLSPVLDVSTFLPRFIDRNLLWGNLERVTLFFLVFCVCHFLWKKVLSNNNVDFSLSSIDCHFYATCLVVIEKESWNSIISTYLFYTFISSCAVLSTIFIVVMLLWSHLTLNSIHLVSFHSTLFSVLWKIDFFHRFYYCSMDHEFPSNDCFFYFHIKVALRNGKNTIEWEERRKWMGNWKNPLVDNIGFGEV